MACFDDVNTGDSDTKDMKEAEFSYYNSNLFQNKREGYFRVADGEVTSYDPEDKTSKMMSLTPTEVSRKVEADRRYLCIGYACRKNPMYIFLDFSRSSMEDLEAWEDLIRHIMGTPSEAARPCRPKSVVTRPSRRELQRQPRAVSAMGLDHPVGEGEPMVEQLPAKEGEVEPIAEDLPVAMVAVADAEPIELHCPASVEEAVHQRVAEVDSLDPSDQQYSTDSLNSVTSKLSSFASLRSFEILDATDREQEIRELERQRDCPHVDTHVNFEELQRLTFGEFNGHVYVSDVCGDTQCDLNIGDRILEIDGRAVRRVEDAESRASGINQVNHVRVKLQRFPKGALCVLGQDATPAGTRWEDLKITLDGTKITGMEMGPFRRACDQLVLEFNNQRSHRAITGINNRLVSPGSTTEQVKGMIMAELTGAEPLPTSFQIHPKGFLEELAKSTNINQSIEVTCQSMTSCVRMDSSSC